MNSGGSSLDEGNDWLFALTSVKDNGNNSVTCHFHHDGLHQSNHITAALMVDNQLVFGLHTLYSTQLHILFCRLLILLFLRSLPRLLRPSLPHRTPPHPLRPSPPRCTLPHLPSHMPLHAHALRRPSAKTLACSTRRQRRPRSARGACLVHRLVPMRDARVMRPGSHMCCDEVARCCMQCHRSSAGNRTCSVVPRASSLEATSR